MSIKEPLRTVLEKYCYIECYNLKLIKDILSSGRPVPYDAELVKAQLKETIEYELISPEEYEQLTEEDFDSRDELQAWLQELWDELP
ncbi:hypothetical protein [Oceanospirillum sediminis]|uniref:Uncharacterized protein n=1 Tax=Oceanospirillum sediminis TaxID=2760088 RepID=A0A839IRE0_9GAMM|nr:hypothetical protein [Oceanospirillum sediminis]MBB1487260.1 hypothetical protein [Oceanospirillum sediminis]